MTIGEVATRSGVSRKALRLYEARGIVSKPRRTRSGYRVYEADVLGVLHFVTQARRLGLTLKRKLRARCEPGELRPDAGIPTMRGVSW